ncbi:MAG: hypothetical protein J2P58_01655 [Acidimicrobiaceae bacterium]|nr:hypothetical protein [Acidimicrobiaceae bacterium]
MSTTSDTTTAPIPFIEATDTRHGVVRPGILASVAAASATTALAAIATAIGVRFADRSGSTIPTLGFTALTLLFSFIGVGLAAALARRARHPRSAFIRTTLTLVLVSFIPDLAAGFDASAAATLMSTHLVAAAIVIPTLASRLAPRR